MILRMLNYDNHSKYSNFIKIRKLSLFRKMNTCFFAAALSSSFPSSVAAFHSTCNFRRKPASYLTRVPTPVFAPLYKRRYASSHFGTNWNNNEKKKKTFLSNIFDKAKEVGSKYLPAVFGQPSEQQRKKALVRREIDESVGALFQNTPFGAVGKAIVRPLLQTMATAFEEQAQSVQQIIDQAKGLIVQDERLTRKLTGGRGTVQTAAPFSQSSSSAYINGRQTSEIGASFEVFGQGSSGVATVLANNGAIKSLYVIIDGVRYNVDLTQRSSRSTANLQGDSSDNIIDAEFVEKK
jgi:hypothetical protein